tara:strand:+ start:329 stop:649 length:321 start_codon:yes stop_codon:yes gene_type:complete
MNINLYIKNQPFLYIKDNIKTIEVRQYKGFIKTLKENQNINLVNKNQTIQKTILKIKQYNNLRQLLENTKLNNINPNLLTISQSLTYYQQYYSLDKLNSSFVAIYL